MLASLVVEEFHNGSLESDRVHDWGVKGEGDFAFADQFLGGVGLSGEP